jgi:hypothetical protein
MANKATTQKRSRRFVVERSPMVIRTVCDVQYLLTSPRIARRLPHGGLVVAIPGLDERTKNEFQSQLNRYIRACGCTSGGVTFLLVSASFIAYAVEVTLAHAWVELLRTIVAALIGVPTLTVIGKLLGLFVARARFQRSCARLIDSLSGRSDWLFDHRGKS